MAHKDKLKVELINLNTIYDVSPHIDIVACKFTSYSTCYTRFVVYIPLDLNNTYVETLIELLVGLFDYENIIIVGDFYCPHFVSDLDLESRLVECFRELFGLKLFKTVPHNDGRLLDLVLSNIECNVTWDLLPIVSEDSYHTALAITFHDPIKDIYFQLNTENKSYNFRNDNFPLLYEELLNTDDIFGRF